MREGGREGGRGGGRYSRSNSVGRHSHVQTCRHKHHIHVHVYTCNLVERKKEEKKKREE